MRARVRFTVRYRTVWGQNLMVIGSGAALGDWQPKRGLWMSCRPCPREPDELIWEASAVVSLPVSEDAGDGDAAAGALRYSYIVVDDTVQVLRREVRARTLDLTPAPLAELARADGPPPAAGPEGGGSARGRDAGSIEIDACDWWDAEADTEIVARCGTFREACLPPAGHPGPPAPARDEGGAEDAAARLCGLAVDEPPASARGADSVLVRFCVRQYALPPDQCVALTGCSFLPGAAERVPMRRAAHSGGAWWEAELAVARSAFPIEYRYCVARGGGAGEPVLEGEPLRGYSDMSSARDPPSMIVINNGLFAPAARRPCWRGFGIAAPVFSLRTGRSIGCGDFRDLRSLVEFTSACRGSVVQILPVNDTGVHGSWRDSYPYSSRSVFALHPLYLVADELLVGMSLPRAVRDAADALRASLECLPDMDYERALGGKLQLARMAFDHAGGEESLSTMLGFDAFVEANGGWLRPYAAFCFLQEVTGTSEHTRWGPWSAATPELVDRITAADALHFRSIAFTYFVQFALHRQLLETTRVAERLGVALKGDLPIGVDKRSADTWQSPELFRMNTSTGAPPDYFDGLGQNWGFPTYVWESMAKDDYAWWKARILRMERYFHAYRIDHILGFFRIWELPSTSVNGMLGSFRPCTPLTDAELRARGVYDIDRLSRPYVRWHDLVDRFGGRAAEVARRFLAERGEGSFAFREEVATERALADACSRDGEGPTSCSTSST